MKRVYVESPYGNDNPKIIQRNILYARACLRDCILRGEAPFASHLLYTQDGVLRDEVPEEREFGMEAGFVWGRCADATVVYMDYGISCGMQKGIERAKREGRLVEYRKLYS